MPNPTGTGDGIAQDALRSILINFGIPAHLEKLLLKFVTFGDGDLRTRERVWDRTSHGQSFGSPSADA